MYQTYTIIVIVSMQTAADRACLINYDYHAFYVLVLLKCRTNIWFFQCTVQWKLKEEIQLQIVHNYTSIYMQLQW